MKKKIAWKILITHGDADMEWFMTLSIAKYEMIYKTLPGTKLNIHTTKR